MIPEHQAGPLDVPRHAAVLEARLRRLGRRAERGARTGGHAAQVQVRRLDRLGRPHVPDDRQDDALGDVMALEVRQEVVPRQRPHLLLSPDAPPPDAVRLEHFAEHHLEGVRAGCVDLPSPLLQDRLDLALQLLRVEQGMHQGVGLDLQALAEVLRRQDDVIVGGVVIGAGVQLAAERLDLGRDLVRPRAIRRPLEEHVLDDVRDADLAVLLVEVARPDPQIDRHDRCGVIRGRQDDDAVRQDLLDDFDPPGHAVTPPDTCSALNIRRRRQGCTPTRQGLFAVRPGAGPVPRAGAGPGGPAPMPAAPGETGPPAGFPASAGGRGE